MEYTQWVRLVAAIPMLAGLNPCCNGIYSMSVLDNGFEVNF